MTDTNYDTDFYSWTQAQAALLRAKDWTQADWGHLIKEIESLGDQYRHALQSHLRVLLWHLLKHRYQPARRTPSWRRMAMCWICWSSGAETRQRRSNYSVSCSKALRMFPGLSLPTN